MSLTNSLCPHCLRKIEAKIVIQDNRGDRVYMHKWCPTHKLIKVLLSTDVPYFKQQRDFIKPGQMPLKFNTPIKYGCSPTTAAFAPDHEQHSCLTLAANHRPLQPALSGLLLRLRSASADASVLEQIKFMLDAIIRNEGRPDIVQISGGEPTIHPDFFKILDMAKIATGPLNISCSTPTASSSPAIPPSSRASPQYMPGFELYLQF